MILKKNTISLCPGTWNLGLGIWAFTFIMLTYKQESDHAAER